MDPVPDVQESASPPEDETEELPQSIGAENLSELESPMVTDSSGNAGLGEKVPAIEKNSDAIADKPDAIAKESDTFGDKSNTLDAPKPADTKRGFQSPFEALGSVRAVVAKNLASLQATKSGVNPGVNAASTETGQVKQGFTSGLSFASFGTKLQAFRQTAVKAVSQPVRHLVSQNKRRYMDGEYDLDLTYITENIIAMGFPAGDLSSGLFGYVEGFYRNHMEEVVRFLDTHHKGKCKVFNLCSERLYDSSLFEGLVACFPFDDHNCPPLPLLKAFCDSAYDWLKKDMDHMVVVHCKAGKSRTGLMICCLLLYLKLFDSADEAIKFYNAKRCTDNQGLTLPSQIRYVHYFESILKNGGDTPEPEARVLRGIRLHKCPYWIRPAITVLDHNGVIFSTKKHPRTKDLAYDDLWHKAPRKGVVVFALPGERCVADLKGDFKILFHDRHGDFYCWLNTSTIETRQFLETKELDWFDRRRLPSPGFQVEVVVLDPATQQARTGSGAAAEQSEPSDGPAPPESNGQDAADVASNKGSNKGTRLKTTKEKEEDEVFGESDDEERATSRATAEPASTSASQPLGTLTAALPKTADVAPIPAVPLPQSEPAKARVQSGESAQTSDRSVEIPSVSASTQPAQIGQPVVAKDKTTPSVHSTLNPPSSSSLTKPAQPAEKTQGVPTSEQAESKTSVSEAASEPPKPQSAQASAVFADDWEADIFGAEDSKPAKLDSTVSPQKASVTSDFAKLAVSGSADASEFTLGDEDDFDSEDGF